MGISVSCPFAQQNDVEAGLESVIVKSISFGDDEVKTPLRSVSFGAGDLELKILKSLGSGKMLVERSVSFKGRNLETIMSMKAPLVDKQNDAFDPPGSLQSSRSDNMAGMLQKMSSFHPSSPKHQAAIKLQKVYKSFRTRRKLADCAVLVEQSWWKLLDFAELKRSSVSFFDIEKHETAISRWSRARTRAAKVGKGLSKNDKAQKLALQHWLEAIDPRHRYGHNLHFYYVKWLHSNSREPFFYWLDIGEGKEVNFVEKCPRTKLQQQCIKYLGPMERKTYEVIVEDGKLIYKQNGELLHTTEDAKWIFVLSTSKTLYVGKKKKGTFQHSSFLAGGVTTAAGRLIVQSGTLKAVWPHSGHYRPTEENFYDFLSFLRENNVDLTDVKTSPTDEQEGSLDKQNNHRHIRNHSLDEDLFYTVNDLETEENNSPGMMPNTTDSVELTSAVIEQEMASWLHSFSRKSTNLGIPHNDLFGTVESGDPSVGNSGDGVSIDAQLEDSYALSEKILGTQQRHMVPNQDLYDQKQVNEIENVPEEAILDRINSKKGMNSYQLGKQLSCKWTTGAGPRIGCVRDYPWELQFRALEQVNLSPRSTDHPRSIFGLSRRMSTPTGFSVEGSGTMDSLEPVKCTSLERSPVLKTKSLLHQERHQWLE